MKLSVRHLGPLVLAPALTLAAEGCGQDGASRSDSSGGAAGSEAETTASSDSGEEAPELSIEPALFTEENTPVRLLEDGDTVDIQQAVQGGQVIYVAARVRNLNAEMARIEAALVDPDSGDVRADDDRTIVMKPVDGEESLFEPDIRSRNQVAHLLVCPNEDSRALLEEAWRLEITISDVDGPRSASAELLVYPTCENRSSDTRPRCDCECVPNYNADSC